MDGMKAWEKWVFYGSAACVGALGATCTAILISDIDLPFKEALAIIVSALSGLATFYAAYIALQIAGKQRADGEALQLQRAHLMAAGLVADLTECNEYLRHYLNDVPLRMEYRFDLADQREYLAYLQSAQNTARDQIRSIASHPAFGIADEALMALMPLPSNTAGRLHAASKVAKALARDTSHDSVWHNETDIRHRDHLLKYWDDRMGWINSHLEIALPVLAEAADFGAPTPTEYLLTGFHSLGNL
jgi:hypothetical protein